MPDETLHNEFKKALEEIRELYDADMPIEERKLRLAARKELNRLHRLYTETADGGQQTAEESETLTEIRNHLEPLGLAADGTPIAELARLAALKLTEK